MKRQDLYLLNLHRLGWNLIIWMAMILLLHVGSAGAAAEQELAAGGDHQDGLVKQKQIKNSHAQPAAQVNHAQNAQKNQAKVVKA